MSIGARQKAILLYASTIFGAFVLIFLLVTTVFTQHFYSLNIFDAGVFERFKSTFTGIGILFIPAGLFFALAIGWIISQELHPRRNGAATRSAGVAGGKEEDFLSPSRAGRSNSPCAAPRSRKNTRNCSPVSTRKSCAFPASSTISC